MAEKENTNSVKTPRTLSFGNLKKKESGLQKAVTSKSGVNKILKDARDVMERAWTGGSVQSVLMYVKPNDTLRSVNYWFYGPDAEKFQQSDEWDDGDEKGLRHEVFDPLFKSFNSKSPDAHHVVVPRPKTKSSTITEEAEASIHKAVERAKKKENDQPDWKNLPMKPKMLELKKRYGKQAKNRVEERVSLTVESGASSSESSGFSHKVNESDVHEGENNEADSDVSVHEIYSNLYPESAALSSSGRFSVEPSPSKVSGTPRSVAPRSVTPGKSPFKIQPFSHRSNMNNRPAIVKQLFQSHSPGVAASKLVVDTVEKNLASNHSDKEEVSGGKSLDAGSDNEKGENRKTMLFDAVSHALSSEDENEFRARKTAFVAPPPDSARNESPTDSVDLTDMVVEECGNGVLLHDISLPRMKDNSDGQSNKSHPLSNSLKPRKIKTRKENTAIVKQLFPLQSPGFAATKLVNDTVEKKLASNHSDKEEVSGGKTMPFDADPHILSSEDKDELRAQKTTFVAPRPNSALTESPTDSVGSPPMKSDEVSKSLPWSNSSKRKKIKIRNQKEYDANLCDIQLCSQPNQGMIQCDTCDRWFHFKCARIKKEDYGKDDPYFCACCSSQKKK